MDFLKLPELAVQPPMLFPAAAEYEKTVLELARNTVELPGSQVFLNQMYGNDRAHRLDVYVPAGAVRPPVLVFWHGGGWTNGYKEYTRFMAPRVNAMGFTLVAPHYRLAPEFPLPAAYEDCRLALQFIAVHPEWGDMRRVYLSGHSAGGHLAALVALRQHEAQDRLGASVSVRACLPISGIMDLAHAAPPPGSLEERVYQMVLSDADDDGVMSPVCWSAGNRIPFLLTYGEHDSERVIRSNRRLYALLRRQHAPVSVDARPGQDHFGTHLMLQDASDPWYGALQQFARATPALEG